MTGLNRLASDRAYSPDGLSDFESGTSCFEDNDNSSIDYNLSYSSRDSDGFEDNQLSMQSIRQWCKTDMKNIPSSPALFSFGDNQTITVNISNNASILEYFELFNYSFLGI